MPPRYEYKLINLPRTLNDNPASAVLDAIRPFVLGGWTFDRVFQVHHMEPPGCIPTLLGARPIAVVDNVVVVRRLLADVEELPAEDGIAAGIIQLPPVCVWRDGDEADRPDE